MPPEQVRYSRFPRHRARRKDDRDSYRQLKTAAWWRALSSHYYRAHRHRRGNQEAGKRRLAANHRQKLNAIAAFTMTADRTRTASIAAKVRSGSAHPNDRSILSALVAFNRTDGNAVAALTYARHLAVITPDDHELAKLIDDLRQATKPPA
jgi:hypothetical protein